jgi:hypothetical protein
MSLLNSEKVKLFTSIHLLEVQTELIYVKIPKQLLMQGKYSADFAIFEGDLVYEYVGDICDFEVLDIESDLSLYSANTGSLKVNCVWY